MTNEQEEMIEIETIQIALNDKLHRIQQNQVMIERIQNNLQIRVDNLKKQFNEIDPS